MSIKAIPLLTKLQVESAPPAMIMKFVHFRAKDTLYSLRKNLSVYRHPLNGEPVFIRERLSYQDAEIKNAAYNLKCHHPNPQLSSQNVGESRRLKNFKQIKEPRHFKVAKN